MVSMSFTLILQRKDVELKKRQYSSPWYIKRQIHVKNLWKGMVANGTGFYCRG